LVKLVITPWVDKIPPILKSKIVSPDSAGYRLIGGKEMDQSNSAKEAGEPFITRMQVRLVYFLIQLFTIYYNQILKNLFKYKSFLIFEE